MVPASASSSLRCFSSSASRALVVSGRALSCSGRVLSSSVVCLACSVPLGLQLGEPLGGQLLRGHDDVLDRLGDQVGEAGGGVQRRCSRTRRRPCGPAPGSGDGWWWWPCSFSLCSCSSMSCSWTRRSRGRLRTRAPSFSFSLTKDWYTSISTRFWRSVMVGVGQHRGLDRRRGVVLRIQDAGLDVEGLGRDPQRLGQLLEHLRGRPPQSRARSGSGTGWTRRSAPPAGAARARRPGAARR